MADIALVMPNPSVMAKRISHSMSIVLLALIAFFLLDSMLGRKTWHCCHQCLAMPAILLLHRSCQICSDLVVQPYRSKNPHFVIFVTPHLRLETAPFCSDVTSSGFHHDELLHQARNTDSLLRQCLIISTVIRF